MAIAPVLAALYQWGQSLDRKWTTPHRLPFPVVSVGNIASGGRAKTPLVIYICQWLKEQGWDPVVLTRGYGRRSRRNFEIDLRKDISEALWTDAQDVGDEAIEIAWLAQSTVLVGSRRHQCAHEFIKKNPNRKRVCFVLDDGFQHWALQRDFDLVSIIAEDLVDKCIPAGFLRESPDSLKRAHCVLRLGDDFQKRSFFAAHFDPKLIPQSPLFVLSTRAPDPNYVDQIKELLPGASLRYLPLKDHALKAEMLRALEPARGSSCLLGIKELVKLLDKKQFFESAPLDSYRIESLNLQAVPVFCELHFKADLPWKDLLKSILKKERTA